RDSSSRPFRLAQGIRTLRLVPRGWMRLISTNFRGSEATEESVNYIIERLFVPTFSTGSRHQDSEIGLNIVCPGNRIN
ncbi:MAG: hypothetical protein O6939_02420, partial [Bacteroidetes bacterium]|nr:hypothetical protein [Bacteroidota bacterium]